MIPFGSFGSRVAWAASGATLESRLKAAAGDSLHSLYLASDVTTNGSGRFRWTDLGPSAYHLDSPSSGADPTTGTAQDMGGLPVVVFDGSTDYLVSTAAATAYNKFSDGTECAIIGLAENLGGTAFQDIFGTANGSTQTGFRISFSTNTLSAVTYNSSSTYSSVGAADHMTGRIISYLVDSSTRVVGGNSGKIGAKTTISSPGASATQTMTVGRRPGLNAAYLNGNVAALVMMVKGAESSAVFAARVASVKRALTDAAFYADPINLICFGNSLTRGVGASNEDRYSYPAQLGPLAGGKATVWEQGYPGIETPEMNDSEAALVAASAMRANNCCVLWEGGNHIHQSDVDSATALAAYTTLTGILRTNGYEGLIIGPTITNRTSFDAGHLTTVSEFNAAILADPGAYGLDGTIDLAAIGSLDPPADDGTHFDDAQYTTIAAAVWEAVEPLFPTATDWGLAGVLGSNLFSAVRADTVTTNGSGRFRMTDLARYSGGRHWDSPGSTNDPTSSTLADLNNREIVVFDGTDDVLENLGTNADWTWLHDTVQQADVWIVGRVRTAETTDFATLLGTSSIGTLRGARLWWHSTNGLEWAVSNGTSYTGTASAAYTKGDAFIFHVSAAADNSLAVDCTTASATTTDTGTVTSPSASASTEGFSLGDKPGGFAEIALDVAEIIFAKGADSTRREIVTEILRQYYDLAG